MELWSGTVRRVPDSEREKSVRIIPATWLNSRKPPAQNRRRNCEPVRGRDNDVSLLARRNLTGAGAGRAKVRNRMMEELHEGVFSDDDKARLVLDDELSIHFLAFREVHGNGVA